MNGKTSGLTMFNFTFLFLHYRLFHRTSMFFKRDRPVVIALLTQGQTVMIRPDIELHEEDITRLVKSKVYVNQHVNSCDISCGKKTSCE